MIHSICGLQNAGKTQYAAILSFIDYLSGRTVLSNIHLSFPHRRINKDFLFYLGDKQPILRNVSFLIDECWLWLDCRRAIENTIGTYFFLQSSKDNSNVRITAQVNSQNETRIRNNLHFYTECNRVLETEYHKYSNVPTHERDLRNYKLSDGRPYNDILNIQCKNFKRDLSIQSQIMWKYINTLYIPTKQFFKLYDTYEKRKRV